MLNIKIPAVNNPIFSTNLSVRIYDINYGNHLGHDSLISLLHEARVRFLQSLGYTELNINNLGLLVTSLIINYFNECFYGDETTIVIEIGEKSRTSFEMIYQVKNNNKEIARALTVLTFYNYEKSKVSKIPQEFLNSMESIHHLS